MKTIVVDEIYHVILDKTYDSLETGETNRSVIIARVRNQDDESEGIWYCKYGIVANADALLKHGSLYLSDNLEEAKQILSDQW